MARHQDKIILGIALLVLFSHSAAAVEKKSYNAPFHVKWVTKLAKDKLVTRRPFQFSMPVVYDSKIYVGSASGHFYALDQKTGVKLWKTKLPSNVYADPLVDGGYVYVADRKGVVYALSRADGKIEWQVDVGEEVSARPAVFGDTIYAVTALRKVVAVDKEGRGRKWQVTKSGALPQMTIKGSSSPVVYNENIYVGYADGSFVCYAAGNGDVLWEKQLSNKSSQFIDVDATPVIVDGIIYIPTEDGKTFALDSSTGREIWMAERGGPNDVLYDNGVLYISGGGVLSAVEAANGRIIWDRKFDGEMELSSPVVKDGLVVVVSTGKKLYVVDAATGDVKYQRFFGKGTFAKPAISEKTIYILTNSSKLIALSKR